MIPNSNERQLDLEKMKFFELKYNSDFESFEDRVNNSEKENFEEWDDYIEWSPLENFTKNN